MTETKQRRTHRRESGERRQEIVDAAAEIFKEKGYAATSIQDVADAVDILKGSLYYYIDSKDDLLFDVIQEAHLGVLDNLEQSKVEVGSALARLRAFVHNHITYNAENLAKIAVFFHDFSQLSPERRQYIVEERDIYDAHLRDLIRDGQREGSIRQDVDPKLASFSILGSMNWTYHWYRPDGAKPISEIADVFAELAVRSVAEPGWTTS